MIKLEKFAKSNKEIERMVKGLDIQSEDILFIGRKNIKK